MIRLGTLLLALLPLCTVAQRNNPMLTATPGNFYPGEAVNTIDLKERKVEGSTFWDESWLEGTVLLQTGATVQDVRLKYDLLTERLEVKSDHEVGVIPGNQIKEFVLIDAEGPHRFVCASQALAIEGSYAGFFEWIFEGTHSLLAKDRVEVLPPNYVPALDAGHTNEQIAVQTTYYLTDHDRLIEIPRRKRKAWNLFEGIEPGMAAYIKQQKLNPKKLDQLVKIVEHLNGH